jgi:hypothetical protein
MQHFDDPARFDVSATYAAVYQRFLALDLADRPATVDRAFTAVKRMAVDLRGKCRRDLD